MKPNERELRLGPDLVKLLLPHRRPLLMVDGITEYGRVPRLELAGYRHVSANEAVFAGHFPDLHLWPGVFTIEGLGQCAHVALVIEGLQRGFEEQGASPEDVLALLRNEQLGASLHPGHRAELSAVLRDALARRPGWLGLSAAVDVKLLEPVFAGQRIDYRVARTHSVGEMVRFEVAATVEGRDVAKGSMSAALGRGAFGARTGP